MLPVEPPYKVYTGTDGKPLNHGYIYFGVVDQNPVTSPVTVYWDAAGTLPAAQPLRTENGYIVHNGTPANVYFNGAYSELVSDSRKRIVFYARNSDEFSIAALVQNFITSISSTTGAALIGGGAQVVSTIAALRLLIKTSASKNALVTGYRTPGDSGGGMFYYDAADTTTADNGGTVIVAADGGRWKRSVTEGITLRQWGCYGNGATDDRSFAQNAVDYACSVNGVVTDDLGLNFKLSAPLTIGINVPGFRSIRFRGTSTGDAQTASSGGSCFIVAGAINCIVASFLTFANENIVIDGFNFYNTAPNQLSNLYAVKLIRGPANARYISGFVFKNIGIMGFGAGIAFQGMNTAAVENNYFGSVIFDNVSIQSTGYAFALFNCVLNLASFYTVNILDCKYGGIVCLPDGDVGAGNGKGSSINASLFKCHFEGVGGMFRTQGTATVGVTGTIRASLSFYDFTHESCGNVTGPVAGEPFAIGVNTDLHFFGYQVRDIPFGEVSLPYLNSTARVYSESPIAMFMNGGRSMSPKMIDAPIYYRTILNGGFTVITVGISATGAFALRSTLILANGQGGMIESIHSGVDSGVPTRVAIGGAPAAGITLTWSAVAGAGAIQLRIDNASGFTYTAELQIENLSSSSITALSEI